ncbi:hypothetical protein [Hymenobacter sp. BRD67]|uniref:hypothetical protein n=1 Tax=Hymenobacter sp. BRD67 TaxID=2675877 RepID=UPI00156616B6|nr:hypothetical protein [Hymenobacter sp. BRD67]QKG53978.1 hypothetical protein GKZ67_16930 [Hymenobacter sp. BRD67]
MVYFNDFSHDTSSARTTTFAQMPPALLVNKAHPYSPGYQGQLGAANLRAGDWIEARVQAYSPEKVYNIHGMPQLVIEFRHPNSDPYKWQAIRITNKIGEITSLWGGTPGLWDEVKFASQLPAEARPEDEVKVYVMNGASTSTLYIDNLSVSALRQSK